MRINYIAIAREYGSGGTQIAQQLAKETDFVCYGKEILEEVSKEQNMTVEQIDKCEETVTNSFLYSVFAITKAQTGNTDMLAGEGNIFLAEQTVIKRLAADHKAIFLGHCASEALKDKGGILKVYIHCTDEEAKKKRIMEEYGIPEDAVDSTRKYYDKKRSNFYCANTARHWSDYKNYDVVLDTAQVGVKGCVEILKSLLAQD